LAHQVELYLQLSEEFGGTKFGPFPGAEIRLGSMQGANDIVLPEALGVMPEHVKIIKQGADSYIVAPTERTAAVFIFRSDGRPGKQITTPVALGPMDGFSLVTMEGPKFILIAQMPAPKKDDAKSSFDRAKKGLSAGSFMEEIKRQGLAKVMTSQAGYIFRTVKVFIVSGAIFSPRNIIMMMMVGTGYIMAGAAGCTACAMQAQMSTQSTKLDDLEDSLSLCEGADGEDPTVATLTTGILKERKWTDTLLGDDTLRKAYIDKLKGVFAREKKYRWVYKKSNSDFTKFQKALSKVPAGVSRVLAYAAANEQYVKNREFFLIKADSEGNKRCGRGPAAITYRQAVTMKFSTVQPDALVEGYIAQGNDKDLKEEQLKKSIGGNAEEIDFDGAEIGANGAGLQGDFSCLYLEGEDDRMGPSSMKKPFQKFLGKNAKKVPGEGDDYWVAARLMKFYVADWRFGGEDVTFNSSTAPTDALGEPSPSQKEYVINNTATLMARSVAIPCMARLDKQVKEAPSHMADAWPTLVQCGVLRLLIERGDI